MFRTRYIKSLIIAAAAAAAAVACTADPVPPADPTVDPVENAEPASLTIDLSVDNFGIGVSTRSGAGGNTLTRATTTTEPGLDPQIIKELDPDYKGEMSPEASFINGSKMTCLTVLLIHRASNKIVGVRRIPDPNCPNKNKPDPVNPVQSDPLNAILNDDGSLGEVLRGADGKPLLDENGNIAAVVGTKARITFDYENPVHIVTNKVIEEYAQKNATSEEDKSAIIAANKVYLGESSERLVRGAYTLLVVANYDHEVTTSSTSNEAGQTQRTLNVDKTLEKVADLLHEPQYMAQGIYPVAPVPGQPELKSYDYLYNIRFLMNHTLTPVQDKERYQEYDVVHLTNPDGTLFYPYIRPAVHQTLTAAAEFYLGAGDNHMDMQLQRISSRTRVEVRNFIPGDLTGYDTDQLVLKVNSLEFSKNYTQSTTYLFRRKKDNRDYTELATKSNRYSPTFYTDHDGKGAPLVTYKGHTNFNGDVTAGAIVPFANNIDVDDDGVNDFVGVPAGDTRCIFDALMYESHADYKDELDDPDSFTYTIDVSYPGIIDYRTHDINKVDTEESHYHKEFDPDKGTFEYLKVNATGAKEHIGNPKNVKALHKLITDLEKGLDATKGEVLCFLVEGVGSHRYLYEKDDGTLFGHTAYEPVNLDSKLEAQGLNLKSFLWILDGLTQDANGNYSCYLKNVGSGKHMSAIPQGVAPTPSNHMMSTDDSKSPKYILGVSDLKGTAHTGTYYATFSNTHGNTPYYLSVWAGGEYLSGWNIADEGCQYKLYPVKMTQATVHVGVPRFKKEVTLTAFSDETAIVEEVREIRRNDFVRILVEVSYSPEEGEFNFRVKPWDKGYGAVDFN